MSVDDKFGDYGGQCVPETLISAIEELADTYERYVLDSEGGSMDDFRAQLRDFDGRPTLLQRVDRLSERYDREVHLKREDLLHGDAHKLNNAPGQVLSAKYMGKERIVTETGAGQRGTATVMACAHLDMPCEIYMGECDINRQRPNVFRTELNGSEVNSVTVGRDTLKGAIPETMRDWVTNVEDTHYVIGSVVGSHPSSSIARGLQSVISEEARMQAREKLGRLPGAVVAYTGGGSNTMGAFAEFVDDEETAFYAVEVGGSMFEMDEEAGVVLNSASLTTRSEDTPHGACTRLLQDRDGQIMELHSVSSGLDYAGVGPELAHLVDIGRVTAANVDDDTALTAFHRFLQTEGIIPTLESVHASDYLESIIGPDAPDAENADDPGEYVVINASGRGDKDLESAIEETYERDIDIAPNMDEFMGGL